MDSDNQTRAVRKDLQELADLLDVHNYRLQDLTSSLASESDAECANRGVGVIF